MGEIPRLQRSSYLGEMTTSVGVRGGSWERGELRRAGGHVVIVIKLDYKTGADLMLVQLWSVVCACCLF